MKATTQLLTEIKELDVYGWFFLVTGFIAASLLIGAAGLAMAASDEHGKPLIIYPIATLFAAFVVLNIGDTGASAKEVFWWWITITFGFAAWSAFGIALMFMFRSLT